MTRNGYEPLHHPPLTSVLKSNAEIQAEASNPYFYKVHLDQQQLELKKQDEHLDVVAATVGTIRQQAYMIHSELGDQAVLLNDMEDSVEKIDGKFDRARRRLDVFFAKSKKGSGKWIIFLILILIALIIVLLVT